MSAFRPRRDADRICLDCGTDNERLLNDDLYIGWRHPRVHGDLYDAFVEEFECAAIMEPV